MSKLAPTLDEAKTMLKHLNDASAHLRTYGLHEAKAVIDDIAEDLKDWIDHENKTSSENEKSAGSGESGAPESESATVPTAGDVPAAGADG
jgi:hypothetical protein